MWRTGKRAALPATATVGLDAAGKINSFCTATPADAVRQVH
jgi:hypothetical protein